MNPQPASSNTETPRSTLLRQFAWLTADGVLLESRRRKEGYGGEEEMSGNVVRLVARRGWYAIINVGPTSIKTYEHISRGEAMDREELIKILKEGPVRIEMNSGSVYVVEKPEFALVADLTVAVLHRCEDGKYRNVILPLVTMTAVEPIAA